MTIHYKQAIAGLCARATIVQECSPTHLQVKVTDMQRQQTVVDCPRSMVGRVIGKGGETIKALQQYTGAMIQIDQSCEPTKVTVAGSAQSLQLAVSMVRDIVAGNFKGFALLRQLTSGTGPQLPQGYEQFTQAQPVYVEGYGFVPPSQADLLRGAAMFGLGTTSMNTNSIASIQPGMLANGGVLGINEGFGGLNLTPNSLAAPGINDQLAQHIGSLTSKPIKFEQLTRGNGLTSVDTIASSTANTTVAPSVSFSQAMSNGNGLPFGWISMADPEGRVFYFNSLTGIAQWKWPLAQ